jgi:hypothetical protein
MKKLVLFLLLCLSLAATSFADYLDKWADEALCGWLDKPSPPSYMVDEVKKRGISCSFGVVLTETVDVNIPIAQPNAVAPGYVSKEFTPEAWLSEFELKPEDLSPMLLELSKKTQEQVPECTDDFCFTTEAEYEYFTNEFTPETWLSEFELKPEDLSPMLLELSKKTQEQVPECTDDFCFTMQPEYGEDPTGEIINKGDLVNLYYRNREPSRYMVYGDPPTNIKGERNICFKDHGCFETRGYYRTKSGADDAPWVWEREELFPLIRDGEIYTAYTEDDWLNEMDDERLGHYRIHPMKIDGRKIITDYSTYKEVNPYSSWDNIIETHEYDWVRTGCGFGSGSIQHGAVIREIRCGLEPMDLEHTPTDEIINTDQLLQSLLFWDPNAIDPNLIHKWEGQDKIVEYTPSDEITNTDQLLQSLLFWDPNALDPNLTHNWEGLNKIIVKAYVENVYDLHPWKNPECYVPVEERGSEFILPRSCIIMLFTEDPLIVQPPLEPTPPVPIRPGWKIAEGSNFWSVDEDDPYWETEEGIKKVEAAKKRGSWIEQEASAYAQENPGVDAPIPSYYATDSCGEGKQPANSSC